MEAETTKHIARRVRELRNRHGLTAADLGERMTKVGVNWDRQIVTNVENGKRQNIYVNELLALARVLDVAPIHLLVPLDDRTPFYVTPAESVAPSDARAWIRGEEPLAGTARRVYRTEAPMSELRS